MKRFICIILIITMCIFAGGEMRALAHENVYMYSQEAENMRAYLSGDYDNLLVNRGNYAYMNYIEDFESSPLSLYFWEMTGIFAQTETEPNKEKYTEVLINIISTYDLDNAAEISVQNSMDNLKSMGDYAMDFAEMGKEVVSVMVGLSNSVEPLEEGISAAVSGLFVLAENTNNWIDALSDLETIMQNYVKYDSFLELIEKNAEGELKEAAISLRKSMSQAMEIKLETYLEISNENFENYSEFFFQDVFFTALKQSSTYNADESFRFFTDCGDEIISLCSTLESSWNLGRLIGILVGNVAVGGEDLINRQLEMKAIHEISVILQNEIVDLTHKLLQTLGTDSEMKKMQEYILYSQYLIGCRIRGEYCLYSIVVSDAGFLSWFNKENAEQAEEWYNQKVNKILDIQENLLKIDRISQDIQKELDVVDLEEYFSRYLSILLESKLQAYSEQNVNYRHLLSAAYHYIYQRKSEQVDFEDEYYVVLGREINDFLEKYFNISVPYETIDNIVCKDDKFYFPATDYGDYGSVGQTVAIIEKVRCIDKNIYEVTFYDAYVYPENWDGEKENPMEDWDTYYSYSVQQMRSDEFIEVSGKGVSIIEKKEIHGLFRNID